MLHISKKKNHNKLSIPPANPLTFPHAYIKNNAINCL